MKVLALAGVFASNARAQTPRLADDKVAVSPATSDLQALAIALAAARRGDSAGVRMETPRIKDPVARKLATWMMIDSEGEQLSFAALDQARTDLADWPRAERRQMVTEKALSRSDLAPGQVVAWFGAREPQTAEGAMALATAYTRLGRRQDAQALIRRWWRTRVFEVGPQRAMLSQFGDTLTSDDHEARMEALLYGKQGPAVRDLLPLLSTDQRLLAKAKIALRWRTPRARALVASLPASVADDPGLAVERASYLTHRGLGDAALRLVARFPAHPPNPKAANRIWVERRSLINVALKARDYAAAYAAATNHGLPPGAAYAEAEFYAGWIALQKLHDAGDADLHFGNIQALNGSPITRARALYWRGRAIEAEGDSIGSIGYFAQASRYYTTFYGQLAADRVGSARITLGHDPVPNRADHERFESRELVRAARLLAALHEKNLFRVFVLRLGRVLTTGEEYVLLVDLAKAHGDQSLGMRAVRLAARRNVVMAERGYPVRAIPAGAPAPIVFGITRQESGFDPQARSPVGARGMMQLMPATAAATARRIGEAYRPSLLEDPDYNIRLGAAYIGKLVNDFDGSLLLAAAAYNAGPGRPNRWVAYCGDPRAPATDPVDFIECIPFGETRNYVMRVLEAAEVYRARIDGGSAAYSLTADLKVGRDAIADGANNRLGAIR